MKTKLIKEKFSIAKIVLLVLLCAYVIGLFVPVIWSVVISFMNPESYSLVFENGEVNDKFLPDSIFSNYQSAMDWIYVEISAKPIKMGALYINSLLYAGISATVFTLCPTIVAYATARFKFRFSKVIYVFVIITMSLPIVGSTPSELRMLDILHIRGKMWSMFFLRFNFLSVYYLILYALFEGIPKDYTEVAKIDGASNWTIMTRIIIPQAMNMIITVFILSFITYWNDFQIPMLYLPKYPTVAQFLYEYSQTAVPRDGAYLGYVQVPDQLAATFIMALPIILVFMIFNKRLRISVAMGGIKG